MTAHTLHTILWSYRKYSKHPLVSSTGTHNRHNLITERERETKQNNKMYHNKNVKPIISIGQASMYTSFYMYGTEHKMEQMTK